MDGSKFLKLCKDCEFLDKHFTGGDADIVFAEVNRQLGRSGKTKIDFWGFQEALRLVAERKAETAGIDPNEILEEMMECLVEIDGPNKDFTKAECVKFHDDKSTYTGTHKQGGPDPGSRYTKSAGCGLEMASADLKTLKLRGR